MLNVLLPVFTYNPPELENLVRGCKKLIHHVSNTTSYKVITGVAYIF